MHMRITAKPLVPSVRTGDKITFDNLDAYDKTRRKLDLVGEVAQAHGEGWSFTGSPETLRQVA